MIFKVPGPDHYPDTVSSAKLIGHQLLFIEECPSADLDGASCGSVILSAVIPEGAVGNNLGGDRVEGREYEGLIHRHIAGVVVSITCVVLEDRVVGLLAADGVAGVIGWVDLSQVRLIVPVVALLCVDHEERPAPDSLADAAPHVHLRVARVLLQQALGLLGPEDFTHADRACQWVPVAVRDGQRGHADVSGGEAVGLDALVAQPEDVGDDDLGARGPLHDLLALLEVGAFNQGLVLLAIEELLGRHLGLVPHQLVASVHITRIRCPDVLNLYVHLQRRVDVRAACREVDDPFLTVLCPIPHTAHPCGRAADDLCGCHGAGFRMGRL